MLERVRVGRVKYGAITLANLQNQLAYVWDALGRSLFIVLIMFIFVQLWTAVYESQDTAVIAGLSLSATIWYFLIAEMIELGKFRHDQKISEEVKDGSIAYTLVRPYNYLAYHFFNGLGETLVKMALIFLLGLPVVLSWPVGGLLAAGAAWIIGKTALGLRSDYLAIATLGISEIIIAVLKNEDWLARGVKNVIGIPRPVPYEVNLQQDPGFLDRVAALGLDPVAASTIYVKLAYGLLFTVVLLILLWLAQKALQSPWGRMMRAIRDNEVAAEAMGKDVTARHLQIFILGSAVCGVAGAMMTTLDGQLTPGTYQPLRFTFLVWVMVIVGGSGNNFGAVLGGFLIWWLWVMVEPIGLLPN